MSKKGDTDGNKQPSGVNKGYQPQTGVISHGYQPSQTVSTQPPNQGSSIKPAPASVPPKSKK
jgi:hypothetical protein